MLDHPMLVLSQDWSHCLQLPYQASQAKSIRHSPLLLVLPLFPVFLLLLHVLQTLPHLGMVRNTARTVISRDIFCLNAQLSNVGIVTRLVTLSKTALPSLPSQVNQAFFQGLLITLLLLLLNTHPLIPLSYLSRLVS